MNLSALAVTSITNFILACETFFLAGLFFAKPKSKASAAWFWGWSLLAIAVSALVGGIDHGFFEIHGQTPIRKTIEHTNWLLIGLLTLTGFLTATRQFVRPAWQKTFYAIAIAQFAIYATLVFLANNFLIVMLNYAPVMLWLLIGNIIGVKNGTGSAAMIAGILLAFLASGIQAAGVDAFSPIDRNSLYHFGMMASVVLLYLGGLKLPGMISSTSSRIH
jgi:hypothetical protein